MEVGDGRTEGSGREELRLTSATELWTVQEGGAPGLVHSEILGF